MRKITQEVIDRLISNGAKVLVEEGYIMLDELVTGTMNGDKVRITGAMFQTWIPLAIWERMPVGERKSED